MSLSLSSAHRQWRVSVPRLPTAIPIDLLAICSICLILPVAAATPLQSSTQPVDKRQITSGGGGGSADPSGPTKIWIPIVVVCGIVFALAVFVLVRKAGWRGRFASWRTGAALASGTVADVRVLTAEQLAGESIRTTGSGASVRVLTAAQLAGTGNGNNGNNSNNSSSTVATTATRTARRARRNRRTPSQISTKSLPVYQKEPGEQELVIYTGPADMEDVPMTLVMPSLDEDAADHPDPDSSQDLSRATSRVYVPEPQSANDMPLLQREDSADDNNSTSRDLRPGTADMPIRPSFETLPASDESQSSLLHNRGTASSVSRGADGVDPRGEAPPYFEVVPMDELHSRRTNDNENANDTTTAGPPASSPLSPDEHRSGSESPSTATSTSHTDASSNTRRRTGLFSLFNPRPPIPPIPPETQRAPSRASQHVRSDSGPSIMSFASSGDAHAQHARTRSRSAFHRPSHSGSGSVFSLSGALSRTRSRSRTPLREENLTSPSMLSVNSISAPLAHTLVRTEFTYPKSGPTPEQLRLISSKESFARFGAPYGADAIAFAASSSGVDLRPPPPEFEEVAGGSSLRRPVELVGYAAGEGGAALEGGGGAPVVVESPVGVEEGAGETADDDAEEHRSQPAQESEVRARMDTQAQTTTDESTRVFEDTPAPASLPAAQALPHASYQVQPSTASNPPPSAFSMHFSTNGSESRASSRLTFATAQESPENSVPSTPVAINVRLPDDSGVEPSTPTTTLRHLDGTGNENTNADADADVHADTTVAVTPV